jgi:hypothetical protein
MLSKWELILIVKVSRLFLAFYAFQSDLKYPYFLWMIYTSPYDICYSFPAFLNFLVYMLYSSFLAVPYFVLCIN